MNKLLPTLLAAIFIQSSAISQPFTDISAGLLNLGYSYAAWGDYDHDGDLDVALTGDPGSTIPTLEIFRNDNGVFTNINAGLPGLTFSSIEWGDYDNDGDLDLLVTGVDAQSTEHTMIIRNDNGTFTDSGIVLPGISDGQASWGDYDNDNDLDILLSGTSSSRILRNDGNGVFTDIVVHLPNLSSASVCWGDYNNDGWLDLALSGDEAGVMMTRLYKNDHGDFLKDSAVLTGVCAGQVKWGDLNNDGLLDLVVAGVDNYYNGHFMIYKNEGNCQFSLMNDVSYNITFASLDLGDYDNDGNLDILLTGKIPGCGTTTTAILYQNMSMMVFVEVDPQIMGVQYGSVEWGDYDNDGFSDLLMTGLDGLLSPVSVIYHNNNGTGSFQANTPPSVPDGLQSQVSWHEVDLSWNRSLDTETPQEGLNYNVFIGTTPASADVLSPMSDLSNGLRKIAVSGNAGMNNEFQILGLPDGTYYWSVQSIDNGFAASDFAPVQTFTVAFTGMNETNDLSLQIFPNPASDRIMIKNPVPEDSYFSIYNSNGAMVKDGQISVSGVDVSHLPAGLYLIRIRQGEKNFTGRFLKN